MNQGSTNDRIEDMARILNQYIKDDTEWKKRAEPVIKFYENITFTNRIFIGILQTIVLIGAVVGAIYAAIKYLK